MNFGEFLDNSSQQGGGSGSGSSRIVTNYIAYTSNSNNMSSGAIAHPGLISHQSFAKPMFNSPGLSLALQTSLEGQGGEVGRMEENHEANLNNSSNTASGRRSRDDEHESRSGSGDLDGASGDDQDADDKQPRKKRYHRHTPQQIQELENLFKECPHPDEKQRLELSRRLCLETRQVKFWFQNRRTQMKTQLERHENTLLRQENDKLRSENMSIREIMRNPMCTNCGGSALLGEISLEEQHLRLENARLRDELDRVCALAGKFLGRPISSLASSSMGPPPMPDSSLELGVGSNGFAGLSPVPSTLPLGTPDFVDGTSSSLPVMSQSRGGGGGTSTGIERSLERSMYLELALGAMSELLNMAQTEEPLWIRSSEGGKAFLNYDEYMNTFTPCIGMKPNGFVSEASRESGTIIINSLALVEIFMDSNKWAEMFPCIVARTSTTDVISSGMGGTKNGALQLMQAELQVLSPLVPVREVNFLRFCKQHVEGVWAVVDVSINPIQEPSSSSSSAPTYTQCRRLPSGFVVQDLPNGYSKVTWIEHAEYDESHIHHLYRPLISAGMGFGARRWITALQRECECLELLMSPAPPRDHPAVISMAGRRSMLKLAQRMCDSFCAGVSASSVHKWNVLNNASTSVTNEDVRVMTRNSVDNPGEPAGIVLSATTSVWLPISCQRLFDFLRDERLRSEWDILSNGGPMQEMAHIAKGQDRGNCVSLLRASAMNSNQNSMLIIQETRSDEAGMIIVYAPVDAPAMRQVMDGGDSAYVALLPSGFAIVPDGPVSNGEDSNGGPSHRVGGSLLTVAFQILVNSLPTAKLTLESVETVNNLISCTIQKIKGALDCQS